MAWPVPGSAFCSTRCKSIADFSGYTDMAIAVARLLGYSLTINFDFPYFARLTYRLLASLAHQSLYLVTGLSLYLVGGNRGSILFTYRNMLLTMLLGGLWHGASWVFMLWGGLHGVGTLIVHRLWSRAWMKWDSERVPRVAVLAWRFLATAMTFYFVCLCWIFFRAVELPKALHRGTTVCVAARRRTEESRPENLVVSRPARAGPLAELQASFLQLVAPGPPAFLLRRLWRRLGHRHPVHSRAIRAVYLLPILMLISAFLMPKGRRKSRASGGYFSAAQTRCTSSWSSSVCRNSPTCWRSSSFSSGITLRDVAELAGHDRPAILRRAIARRRGDRSRR